jgi:hypothetical protein
MPAVSQQNWTARWHRAKLRTFKGKVPIIGSSSFYLSLLLIAILCRNLRDPHTSILRGWLIVCASLLELRLRSEPHTSNYRVPNVLFNRSAYNLKSLNRPGFRRLAADWTGKSTTLNFNNISSSNRPVERPRILWPSSRACSDQQWFVIQLLFSSCCTVVLSLDEMVCNGFIQQLKKGTNSLPVTHYLINIIHREVINKFLKLFFKCQFYLLTSCIADWRSLQCRNSKMRYCIQPVEMLGIAIR